MEVWFEYSVPMLDFVNFAIQTLVTDLAIVIGFKLQDLVRKHLVSKALLVFYWPVCLARAIFTISQQIRVGLPNAYI